MKKPSKESSHHFRIYIDGASRGNPGHAAAGILIMDSGNDPREIKKYLGKCTNNQAEYMALITALETFRKPQDKNLSVFTDSQLVANQINGKWKVKHPDISKLYKKAKDLIKQFHSFSIEHISRNKNSEADSLANQAIDEYLNN